MDFMQLKKMKPTTNGLRHKIKIEKNLLAKNNKIVKKTILQRNKNLAGRSSITGNITVWHKGKRQKRLFRKVILTNETTNSIVVNTCYDPARKAFINLNFELEKKEFFFNLSSDLTSTGSLIKNSAQLNELKLGYRTSIESIPTGSIIHNLSIKKTKAGQYIRAAGTFGQIIQKGYNSAKIKLPSKKIVEVPTNSYATIGVVSNLNHNRIVLGKAGSNRYLGIKPTVRGIAMNPVDHPHGGRTNGGRPSVTPWGLPTKGQFKLKKRK